jgi:hypothetical protein
MLTSGSAITHPLSGGLAAGQPAPAQERSAHDRAQGQSLAKPHQPPLDEAGIGSSFARSVADARGESRTRTGLPPVDFESYSRAPHPIIPAYK